MSNLIYTGPHLHVTVPIPTGGSVACERGGEIEVPDSLGERLLDQASNWQRVKRPAVIPAAKPAEQKKEG